MSKLEPLRLHQIPKQWEEITPEWVTAAIAHRHPKSKVKTVTVAAQDDGTNRRARLELTYVRGTGPRALFLKSHNSAHRSVHLRNGNLFNEARLFASRVRLDIEHPVVHRSIVDWYNANFLLVMEDVTEHGGDPRDATRPMTVEQVAHGLRGLARLHSRYWGFSHKRRPKLRWVKTWQATEGWQVGLKKRIPIGLERAAGKLAGAISKYDADQIVDLWSRYVTTLTQGPMTLLHGDAHIGNTYVLANGGVGFLDWQVVRRGGWSQDVGYFLVGSLTEEDRRSSERELLKEYCNALEVPSSERPSGDHAWLAYRTTPAYGLAVWLSTLGTDGWQSTEVSSALAQRYASAFAELETAAALNDASTQ